MRARLSVREYYVASRLTCLTFVCVSGMHIIYSLLSVHLYLSMCVRITKKP